MPVSARSASNYRLVNAGADGVFNTADDVSIALKPVYMAGESRVVLQVEWDNLEAHTVGFRQSPAFAEWRAIIGPYFARPPHVEHFDVVASS